MPLWFFFEARLNLDPVVLRILRWVTIDVNVDAGTVWTRVAELFDGFPLLPQNNTTLDESPLTIEALVSVINSTAYARRKRTSINCK